MRKLFCMLLVAALICGTMSAALASQEVARQLGTSAIGMECYVNQDGLVKVAPDVNAQMAGRVKPGQCFTVLGVTQSSGDWRYWYLVEWKSGWYGWIAAGIVDFYTYEQFGFVGEGYCIVTGAGIHGKSGPGVSYSKVATCTTGNGFRVFDVQRGDNGKNWYLVSIQGISCWIPAASCRYYSYWE